MGTLLIKAKPCFTWTRPYKKLDHAWVECSSGTGKKKWGCFGHSVTDNETREIGKGSGVTVHGKFVPCSTVRAEAISVPKQDKDTTEGDSIFESCANIRTYGLNGVCHQAANRIAFPAGILSQKADGYGISHCLFYTYGRVGIPCSWSTFFKHEKLTGDLQDCIGTEPTDAVDTESTESSAERESRLRYIDKVLEIYGKSPSNTDASSDSYDREFEDQQILMGVEFLKARVGYILPEIVDDLDLMRELESIHISLEKDFIENVKQLKNVKQLNEAFSKESLKRYFEELDRITKKLQADLWDSKLNPDQCMAFLGVSARSEPFSILDREIMKRIYGFESL
ncbi:MAG: hypothetical protein NTX45_10560 [Proteobacteria bacterium]|nr:hypothetical protein [Pseudomonadota bacterium]